MKWLVFISLLVHISEGVFGQRAKIDSLCELSIHAGDEQKIFLFHEVAKEYLEYRLDSALYFQIQSYFLAKKLQRKDYQALCLNNFGKIYLKGSDFAKSLQYFKRAYAAAEELKLPKEMAISLRNTGELYCKWRNYTKAYDNYEHALQIIEKVGSEKDKTVALHDISNALIGLGQIEKAKNYLLKGLVISERNNLKKEMAALYASLGDCYASENKNQQTLVNYNKALTIYNSLDHDTGVVDVLVKLAKLWVNQGQYPKAHSYVVKIEAYRVFPIQEVKKYYLYSIIADSLKDYQKALTNYKKYTKLKDNIFNKEKFEAISKMEVLFGNEKNEKRNVELETKLKTIKGSNENQQRIIVGTVISIILTIALFTTIFLKYYSKYKTVLHINSSLQMGNVTDNKQNVMLQQEKMLVMLECDKLRTTLKKKEEEELIRRRLSGMLVHDLKTPLNAIIGISQLEVSHENEHTENYQLIYRSGTQLLQLVNNVLDIEKMDEAMVSLTLIEVNAIELVEFVKEQMRFALLEKSMSVDSIVGEGVKLIGDRVLLERVLINLVSNAIKYSSNNEGIIIRIFQQNEKYTRIEIEDSGEGISAEYLPYVFDRFTIFSKSKNKQKTSTGLGLAFCKMAIELHGGEIGVVSEENSGALFWVILPLTK